MLVAGISKRYEGSLLIVPPLVLGEQIHNALHVMAFRRLAASSRCAWGEAPWDGRAWCSVHTLSGREPCPLRCTVASYCHRPLGGERPSYTREARGALLLSGASSWLVLLDNRLVMVYQELHCFSSYI